MSTKRAQFTQGPWVVKSTDEDINTKTIIDSNEFWIAKVLNFDRASDDIRESQANANLIAAAPAMYEALRMLTSEINLSTLNVRKDFSLMNAHACAVKAILQAEGKLL